MGHISMFAFDGGFWESVMTICKFISWMVSVEGGVSKV